MSTTTRRLPKLFIQRSWLLDQALARPKKWPEPTASFFIVQVKKLRSQWAKQGPKILRSIARQSGLTWHQWEIPVYVSYGVRPFSNPLTISLKKDINLMIDVLTHELIHRLVSEPKNWRRIEPAWERLIRQYRRELPVTQTHIVIHAIHELVLLDLFGRTRLDRERRAVKLPAYRRAWEIVGQLGAKNIVQLLLR